MCGVVNVTHVERRGHDQVGSGWQDSAFDASMLRIRVCVYVCIYVCVWEECQGLPETVETLWLTGLLLLYSTLPRKKQEFSCDSDVLSMG